jgi:hypothetical protein
LRRLSAAKIFPMILVLPAAMIVAGMAKVTVPLRNVQKIDNSNFDVAQFFNFFADGIFNEIDYTFQVLMYELI